MPDNTILFHPLYFTYHDCWSFRTWRYAYLTGWEVSGDYQHRGHVHFFMPEHNINSPFPGRAYTGTQTHNFKLDEDWSPNSKDPNQTMNLKIIGTPKWFFYIREYWRRVYIQQWDDAKNSKEKGVTGKLGIKWDASQPFHTFGPFREGKDNFFYWTNMARTLPVEYWKNPKMTVRDHFLRTNTMLWNSSPEGFDSTTTWTIPRGFVCGSPSNYTDGDPQDFRARCFGYPDSNYIYPTIEYQSVEHLNWERLPGYENRPEGDGYTPTVTIPFKNDNGIIQSPFSDDEGNVSSPGVYHHNFEFKHPDKVLKFAETDSVNNTIFPGIDVVSYDKSSYDIPADKKGEKIEFHVPSHMQGKLDGMWVEQCLGAVVLARVEVLVEDNFGGQYTVYVKDTQFMVRDNFVGKDQNAPISQS